MHVLVLSDDRWHPAQIARTGLAPLMEQGFTFDWIENAAEWSAERMAGYPVVLFVKSNNVSASDESPWMTEEVAAAFVDYVRRGNGLLVVHSGSAGYAETPTFRALLGGVFVSHPPQCPVTVEPQVGHPITVGVTPFTAMDEHYMMALDDADADVFMITVSAHGTQPGGWTRFEGAGRVCMLTPGHNVEVWQHPSFQTLLSNALHWCAATKRTVLVTGADRGLGLGLTAGLLEQGWRVFAGQYMPAWPELGTLARQYPGALHIVPLDVASVESAQAAAQTVATQTSHLDMLINNAGVSTPTNPRTIREAQDYGEMHRLFDINALGPLRVVEAFLPLLDRGTFKRLCFVSSEAGSITRSYRDAWFGYCMSKAALNMAIKNLFNYLRPAGYTFRVYHPGWVRSYIGGQKNNAADLEPEEAAAYAIPFFVNARDDEDRLVLVDYEGNEWPW
ncbi:MAG TPA: SDR family NAD(P)-dependent oxidoreductase [Anaerolineae bacterium]|nr:SDR family NAD(P)-dependent oxidoreductase [Anaerolineae bacterium]HQH39431.1 SDR family NAD(P)-dependent oxidoreductase [Anaerolineae bacterium]